MTAATVTVGPTLIDRHLMPILIELDGAGGDGRALVPTIEAEPELARRVMGLANTPLFGGRMRAGNLWAAIVALGSEVLRSLVVVHELELWAPHERDWATHAVDAASAAAVLARRSNVRGADAFAATLLHDLGAVMTRRTHHELWEAVVACHHPVTTADLGAERQLLGFTHDRVGRDLLIELGFREHLAEAAGLHNISPDHAPSRLSQVVIAGIALAELEGTTALTAPVAGAADAAAALQLVGTVGDLAAEVRHEAPLVRALLVPR